MQYFKTTLFFAITLLASVTSDAIYKVETDRFINMVEKNFLGLNLDPLNFYSDASGEQCANTFKLVDTLVLTGPGYVRITTPNTNNHEMKISSSFYKNFFKFVKDIDANIILNGHNEEVDDLDITHKIITAEDVGLKSVYVEVDMDEADNATCHSLLEDLNTVKTMMGNETSEVFTLNIVLSHVRHCLSGKSDEEKKHFLFKMIENSNAILFDKFDIEAINMKNLPTTLRVMNSEPWYSVKHESNIENEKRFAKAVEMIGDATRQGFTRVFEDIENVSNRKTSVDMSGLDFFLAIYKISASGNIFNIGMSGNDSNILRDVNVFAQCGEQSETLFLYAVNTGNQTHKFTINNVNMKMDGTKFTQYLLKERNGTLFINDEPYSAKNMDKIVKAVDQADLFTVYLPGNSVGLWPAIPVKDTLCKKILGTIQTQGKNESTIEDGSGDSESSGSKRMKRNAENESPIVVQKEDFIFDEQGLNPENSQILVLVVDSLNNDTEDVTSLYETIEEQYVSEIRSLIPVLKSFVEFMRAFYGGDSEEPDVKCNKYTEDANSHQSHIFENEINESESESENEIPKHEERSKRQAPAMQMEDRIGQFGKVRPLQFSPPEKLKLDSILQNARHSMTNLKQQSGLNHRLPSLHSSALNHGLKEKLRQNQHKFEHLRLQGRPNIGSLGLKQKFHHLSKREVPEFSDIENFIEHEFPRFQLTTKRPKEYKKKDTIRDKWMTNYYQILDSEDPKIKKRYPYPDIWDHDQDKYPETITNENYKYSTEDPQEEIYDESFDLTPEASSNDWSWENIKCKLGFCTENPLEKITSGITTLYENVKQKANEFWEKMN